MYFSKYLSENIYFAVVERNGGEHVEAVERAMVAIRRSQSRRTLARLAAARQGTSSGAGHGTAAAPEPSAAGAEVLDVVEEAEESGGRATVTSVAAALGIDQPRASK